MGNPYAPPGANRGSTPPQDDAPDGSAPPPTRPTEPPGAPVPPPSWPTPPPDRPTPAPGYHPGGVGSPRPPRPAPDPAAAKLTTRRTLYFCVALLALLLTTELPFPWSLAGLAVAAVTVVLGVRAMATAFRARSRGLTLPAIVVGLGLTGMFALQLIGSAATWNITSAYQTCMDEAITVSAKEGCTAAYQEALKEEINKIAPSAPAGG